MSSSSTQMRASVSSCFIFYCYLCYCRTKMFYCQVHILTLPLLFFWIINISGMDKQDRAQRTMFILSSLTTSSRLTSRRTSSGSLRHNVCQRGLDQNIRTAFSLLVSTTTIIFIFSSFIYLFPGHLFLFTTCKKYISSIVCTHFQVAWVSTFFLGEQWEECHEMDMRMCCEMNFSWVLGRTCLFVWFLNEGFIT